MSDDLVKSHIEWLRGDHEQCNPFLADRIEALSARVEAADTLAEMARRLLDNYGFPADGGDNYREVSISDITGLDAAHDAYRDALGDDA